MMMMVMMMMATMIVIMIMIMITTMIMTTTTTTTGHAGSRRVMQGHAGKITGGGPWNQSTPEPNNQSVGITSLHLGLKA
eukprot:4940208-Karenia_brevis.AAC.1